VGRYPSFRRYSRSGYFPAVFEFSDDRIVTVAVVSAYVGLRGFGELYPVVVVGAVDDELDVGPEMAFDPVEVAGICGRGQQPHMVGARPVTNVSRPVCRQAVHHDVELEFGRVTAANVFEELQRHLGGLELARFGGQVGWVDYAAWLLAFWLMTASYRAGLR
jgi:hypothetical protein